MDRTRRTPSIALALLAPTVLAACATKPSPEGGATAPSVVLVTLDTTRADYLSAYGATLDRTPNLDALAADGTLFDLAVSTAAVTPVSHASILTGLNPPEHHLRVLSAPSGYRLPRDVPTLTTILKAHGYATAAVHSAFPVSAHFGFDNGFDVFDSFDAEIEKTPGRDRWDVERFQRRSDATTDLVLDVLKDLPRPFFLWVHYWDPHDAKRLPPDDFLAKCRHDEEGWVQKSRLRYAAEVAYVDLQIGRLFDGLRAAGVWQDALVAVVADHGEGLGEHGWQGHRLLYQEQIHVPLILRLPGAPRGRRVPQLVRTIDIVPTLLDWLGIAAPGPLDGRSLRPLIEGRPDEPRIAYADQINGYDFNANILHRRPDDDFLYCVMDARWKLIYYPDRPDRSHLFDLQSDPEEAVDLWAGQREERTRLLRELASRQPFVSAPFPAQPGADATDDEAARDALAGLGYTDGGALPPRHDDWVWTCPVHDDLRAEAPGRCPTCGAPLLLRSRE